VSDSDFGSYSSAFAISAAYEMLIEPHYTIGGRIDFFTGKAGWKFTDFSLSVIGRYYTMSASMEKLYLGAGLGFDFITVKNGGSASAFGLLVDTTLGWKQVMNGKIIVDPAIGYRVSKAGFVAGEFGLDGWYAKLSIGMLF
jgi:hypothetical protein